jgi:hypothetical protein
MYNIYTFAIWQPVEQLFFKHLFQSLAYTLPSAALLNENLLAESGTNVRQIYDILIGCWQCAVFGLITEFTDANIL